MRMSSHFADVSSSYSTQAIDLLASAARARLFCGGYFSFSFLPFSFLFVPFSLAYSLGSRYRSMD